MGTGINVASFSFIAVASPKFAASIARDCGLDFVSGLPLRGMPKPRNWSSNLLPIKYWEQAWNPGGISEFLKGRRENDPTAPKLQDIVAFPSPKACGRMDQLWLFSTDTILIVHSISDYRAWVRKIGPERVLLEINPGMFKTYWEIVEELRVILENGRSPFCLDLRHIRETARPDQVAEARKEGIELLKFSLGDWRPRLPYLLSHTRLVDFQATSRAELEATLAGEETELAELTRAVKGLGYAGDWRVEVPLGLKDALKSYKLLEDIVAYTRS